MKYFEIPDEVKWRPAFIDELLKIRKNEMTVEGFSEAEINDMLNIVCISQAKGLVCEITHLLYIDKT